VSPLQFFCALGDAADRGPWTLAIVRHTRGSTPRSAGALMAVNAKGELIGSIGGGAGEARVVQNILGDLRPCEVTINLSGRGDQIDGICGGEMRVQILRCPPNTLVNTLNVVIEKLRSGGHCWIDQNDLAMTPRGSPTAFEVRAMPQVVVVGGGHCGAALAKLTDELGFPTLVVDDREMLERTHSQNIAQFNDIKIAIKHLYADPAPLAVLLTRHFEQDLAALHNLRDSLVAFGFIGMMGSAKRIREVFAALNDHEFAQKITAPVGFDIGAQTPTEIAVSIAAQLIGAMRSTK
jgi:xanthine dehydrogenase accessory factor